MTAYKHQEFLKSNEIALKALSKPLSDMIEVFSELQHDLQEVDEKDIDTIESKLSEMDQEIYEYLVEEFEHDLQHNELPETEAPKPKEKKVALSGDEKILQDLLGSQSELKGIKRSLLKAKGFNRPLNTKEIIVGGYRLKRTRTLSYTYVLSKIN